MFNAHKGHTWFTENPREHQRRSQACFCLDVWIGSSKMMVCYAALGELVILKQWRHALVDTTTRLLFTGNYEGAIYKFVTTDINELRKKIIITVRDKIRVLWPIKNLRSRIKLCLEVEGDSSEHFS